MSSIANDQAAPTGGSVRRHHTITATSRSARGQPKDIISEEAPNDQQALWNNDEPVDDDWVGGVGAVGEKSSLHRQSSLPTRSHRGFGSSRAANAAQKPPVNSLAAIAGHEGDEEPWNLSEYSNVDDVAGVDQQQIDAQVGNTASPMSPHFQVAGSVVPSPPPAGSAVRRHVSLNYGPGVGGTRNKTGSGLKRSGTLQATVPQPHSQGSSTPDPVDYSQDSDYQSYESEDLNASAPAPTADEEYYLRQQANIGRQSPWSQANEWRAPGNANGPGGNAAIDDVQRALSQLEIASSGNNNAAYGAGAYGNPQPQAYPPRFSGGPRGGNMGNNNSNNMMGGNNNYDAGRRTPNRGQNNNQNWDQGQPGLIQPRRSNPNLQYAYQQGGHSKNGSGNGGPVGIPAVPPIPQQYLQQQQGRPGLGVNTDFNSASYNATSGQTPVQGFVNTPIDVPALISSKGYNPANFDTKPTFARFFVIKSYTEDDVHKSLKYEIWSSTDPGNKRLDKAFKETAGRGPIYLFFSVNASGHFCGMAEMLTPVDYTRSSTVWASDKWKGVFKVRWIFVRDIPNASLRHIKLNNTQERKPVTNSRDTQELLPDAGQEMLRIFHTHPSRTSLLQDFAFYELQAMQKMQAQTGGGSGIPPVPLIPNIPTSDNSSPPNQPSSSVTSPQLSHSSLTSSTSSPSPSNASANAPYQNNAYMTPMMQMQMQMQMGMGMGGVGGMGITAPMNGMGMPANMGMGNMGMNPMNMGNMGGMGGMNSNAYQAVMRHSDSTPPQGQQLNQGQDRPQRY